jgi:arylsulfatase A-like enzyme
MRTAHAANRSRCFQSRGWRRALFRTVLVVFMLAVVTVPGTDRGIVQAAQPSPSRPNVVLILMDDLGYGDLGSYGATDIKTPHVDRLAREGVRLTDGYSNGVVCSPTRAALMTGRYQQRVGIEDVLTILPESVERGLPATGRTLPALLKQNGYETALFGKWHLGYKPEFGPNAHGFTEFFGFLSGAVDYYTHQRNDGKPDLFENTTPVTSEEYLTDAITRRAVSFIDRTANRPFFVEVAYNAAHWPFQPPDRPPAVRDPTQKPILYQAPWAEVPATRQDYARMVEHADAGIGQILTALERHGLTSNTLVIFTNDNGGEWLSRNAPFFNRKGSVWEGGIRVPLILRWPQRLPAGATSPQVAVTMDLTATILSATQTAVPADYPLDGIDLIPHLREGATTTTRQIFWRGVPHGRVQTAVRDGDWKLLNDEGRPFLFNVRTDPGERDDFAARRPDIVRKLSQLFGAWRDDVGITPPALQK